MFKKRLAFLMTLLIVFATLGTSVYAEEENILDLEGYKNIQNINEIPDEANIKVEDIKYVDDSGNLPTKEISVSYRTEDKMEIFGKMNEQEIRNITSELMDILNSSEFRQDILEITSKESKNKLGKKDILEDAKKEIEKRNILGENQKVNFSKLSISVIDSSWSYDPNYSEKTPHDNPSYFKNIEPLIDDTKPFNDTLRYNVSAIFANAEYEIYAEGSIFIPRNAPTIENASGEHIDGEYGGSGNPIVLGSDEMMTSFTFRGGGLIKTNSAHFYINSNGNIVEM